jgi:rhamnosyltransferase
MEFETTEALAVGPHVTVLLAAHNGEQHIAEQIESILGQESVATRIVVSLDQSSDDSAGLLQRWADNDPRIELLPMGATYGGAAPNFYRLLRDTDMSRTDYVAFADQDDVWFSNKLGRAVSALTDRGVAGYSSNVLAWYADGRRELVNKAWPQRRWDHLFSSPGPGCTHVLRVDLARELQQLLSAAPEVASHIDYHDWLDYAFARERGYGWFIDPEPSMLYRQHERNQLGANLGVKAALRRARDLRSSWLWDQASLIGEAVGASDAAPLRLLHSARLKDRLRLILLTPQMRRRKREALALAITSAASRPISR